jgi:catechol 2,3-dioxygenase-like lactoylglutathione lyase family enzyme
MCRRVDVCAQRTLTVQQQVSVVTLGMRDLAASRRFYVDGFGWQPVFENEEIVFYQMNGFVLGTWLAAALAGDMRRPCPGPGAFALAHNVRSREEVESVIAHLARAGGRILRAPDAPAHGGFRGYVADPDDHAWEIAWNPAWPISPEGYVTFR